MKITQAEADNFIKMQKVRKNNNTYTFPDGNECLSIELSSADGREEFILDINRGRISLNKCSYQNRVMVSIRLVRVCINQAKHSNPDGVNIDGNHIHIYREGYGDKWAYPLPKDFSDITKLDIVLDEFMTYCNIVSKPVIHNIWNMGNEC